MENLVGIRVPVGNTNSWFPGRFFSSPWCRQIRDLQTSRVSAGSSASGPCTSRPGRARPGPPRRAPGRPCPSGSGRDSAPPQSRRRSAPSRRRRSGRPHPAARRPARTSTTAVLVGSFLAWGCQLEAASEHRVDDHPVAIQIDEQELAASCDPLHPRPSSAASSASSATSKRPGLGAADRPSAEGGVKRFGDNREVRRSSGTAAIVAARTCVLDSPGPEERQDG